MNASTHTVVCPHCQAKLRLAAASTKQVRCPKCQVPFRPAMIQSDAVTRTTCGSCQAKVKGVKPGAKFKCPKCGAIERAASAVAATSKNAVSPASKPAGKPTPAKKPTPKPAKSMAKIDTKAITDATQETDSPAEPRWKPDKMPVATPKPASPAAGPSAAASNRNKRRDDEDDEESNGRISGRLLTTLVVLVAIGAIVGAWSLFSGDSGPDRGAITGEVTLDGAPVAVGTILFKSLDPKTKHLAVPEVPIENGKYKIAREQGPAVGMCSVEIRVKIKTGRKKAKFMGNAGETEDEIIEGAADRFNKKSELTFDVKAGANTKNFEVSGR